MHEKYNFLFNILLGVSLKAGYRKHEKLTSEIIFRRIPTYQLNRYRTTGVAWSFTYVYMSHDKPFVNQWFPKYISNNFSKSNALTTTTFSIYYTVYR